MVLVNTTHLKGSWKVHFEREDSKEGTFHLNYNNQTKVDMMMSEGSFAHGDFGG